MENVINLFRADYLLFNNDSQCAYVDNDDENCIVHEKDFVLVHFFRLPLLLSRLATSHIILKINKSSHQILLLFSHCTIRCTIMSLVLLPLLEQSTLLSGFQTYVTATSSSDDIYCGKNKI